MAESTSVLESSAVPAEDLKRAEKFTLESYVHEGEDAAAVLAPGTPRRRALDEALAEIDAGLSEPSVKWRQHYSLMLGLERLVAQDEPKLVDGTVLDAHQVDALSGTLIALLAEAQSLERQRQPQRRPRRRPRSRSSPRARSRSRATTSSPTRTSRSTGRTARPTRRTTSRRGGRRADDPNAARRFWFEHATGAGKSVAALGFVEASRTGGVLILTHRRNLVEQFEGELRDRGYRKRIAPALLKGEKYKANGPVTVETYQWFVRNAGNVSDAYTIVICDEAHTALGEKTSAAIREWHEPTFVGMTATGALIARHVTDLFPTQTSRFDLAQAARRGVIAPLRDVRIPPGVGVRTIAKVPLRKGEVDQDFDQEELAALLDQHPFNMAIADLYRVRFKDLPGVVYAAGVQHAYNVAQAFKDAGMKAKGVSGETPKRELTRILAAYERGEIDVLVNAQLLAEGWNSPRATVCMHLAPTASKRIYQQRVGRVTRRHPGKEAGIVVDFVHPATTNDDPVVTLHSLLDRDVYRGGAIVVGPVRRGRGRRLRVERRVLPVTADPERRAAVFERELWRIAVEHLSWQEQHVWAALAGARVASNNWRRAKAMLHFDSTGELRRRFVITCLQRNRNSQLRIRALQEIAQSRDAEAFDEAVDIVGTLVARRAPRGRQDAAPGTRRALDRPPRPGDRVAVAARRVHARGARGVRGAALAGDQAAARPARELVGRRARAQRAPARAGHPQARPPAGGGAARRRAGAHARGRGGAARRAHPDGTQAERARARAAAELPQGPPPARRPPAPRQGRRRGGRRQAGGERRRAGRRRRPTTRATRSRTQSGGGEATSPAPSPAVTATDSLKRRRRNRRRGGSLQKSASACGGPATTSPPSPPRASPGDGRRPAAPHQPAAARRSQLP